MKSRLNLNYALQSLFGGDIFNNFFYLFLSLNSKLLLKSKTLLPLYHNRVDKKDVLLYPNPKVPGLVYMTLPTESCSP